MPHKNIVTGESEAEIWKVIAGQLKSKEDNLDYTAQFDVHNYRVTLDIDIHPDRGDDNEKPFTSFSVHLPDTTDVRFSIQEQGFKHEIRKLFGMQDVIIGNPVFDKKYLIQSNEPAKVKEILSHAGVGAELLKHPVIFFGIRERKIAAAKDVVFVLDLDGGITEADKLKDVFQSFAIVLNHLE